MTDVIARLSDRRIFFLGVNTGYVTDGLPNESYVEFYRRRASPQLHCAIVGNVVVPGGHGSNVSTPTISDSGIWEEVSGAIADRGSIPGLQLATVWPGYTGRRSFVGSNTGQIISEARELVLALGPAGASSILDAFDLGVGIATLKGFRHIQLHGAHGYLLGLLIDSRINVGADAVLDRLSSIGKRLFSEGVESSIRISMRSGDEDFDSDGMEDFLERVSMLPFDYIDLSSGFYNIDKRLIYPSRPDTRAARMSDSCALARRFPARQFIFSGRALLSSLETLPSNLHIGLCRDLIANPNYLNDLDNGCQNRSRCHYYSRGADKLTCALWGEKEAG